MLEQVTRRPVLVWEPWRPRVAAVREMSHPGGRTLADGSALQKLHKDPELGQTGEGCSERRGAWRQIVLSRARRARLDLFAALDARSGPVSTDPASEEVAALILRAKTAAVARVWPWAWFEGSHQERAWFALHEAEAGIAVLSTGERFVANARRLALKAKRVLGEDDLRVQSIALLLNERAVPPAALRVELLELARATFDALDDHYAQSRGYRNRLIRLTGVAVAAVVLALVLDPMRDLTFVAQVGGARNVPGTLALVTVFGGFGALVSALPGVAKAQGGRNPFSLPLFQLLLKVAMGPLFALVGVMIVQSGVVAELRPAESLSGLLAWATMFGAAQQTVTRFVDRRVSGFLGEQPPKGLTPRPTGRRKSEM